MVPIVKLRWVLHNQEEFEECQLTNGRLPIPFSQPSCLLLSNVFFFHTFNLPLILSLQVSDQCHFRGEKPVLQWRWLSDAPEAGHNPSEQGEEVGEGRTLLWQSLGWAESGVRSRPKSKQYNTSKESSLLVCFSGHQEQETGALRVQEKPGLKHVSPSSCYSG